MKILAVVVTHNRCQLLSRCIDGLLRQTRQPDAILVINNASTDGTVEMLQAQGIDVVTQENLGSAGGWHRGIQQALELDYDAVWLMDDDGFPDAGALQVLRQALISGVACASSVVVCEDNPSRFVFPYPMLDDNGLPRLLARRRKVCRREELAKLAPEGVYEFAHFFNGALLLTACVRRVGNVNQNYFMCGDEVDYFFRLRAVGRVVSVLSALHYHPDVSRRPYTTAKVYYYLKNTLVLNARYFNAVWFRHFLTVLIILGRTIRRNGFPTALSLLAGRQAPIFYSAITRGSRGQLGKDFNG